jgi:D-glycero-alpha-D-manno-heptose-7-phosphate kinase
MIISRTPTRVSFFGGGTDYPEWYRDNSGAVISASINKYNYITVRELPPYFNFKHRIRYYEHEEVNDISEIKHPSVRECAKFLSVDTGLEVVHNGDIPSRSGIGSSSSFTVGMLNAIYAMQHRMPTKQELAENAIHVEQNLIGENVGSQDQVAVSFGGFNYIKFNKNLGFEVEPIIISESRLLNLQSHLMLCFTGFSRTASEIAKNQISSLRSNSNILSQMSQITNDALTVLLNENTDIRQFGELLNFQWALKKQLDKSVSNFQIDEIYDKSLSHGAIGGKLLGAGAGGFMLLFAEPDKHSEIKNALFDKLFVPFKFEFSGSSVIYISRD